MQKRKKTITIPDASGKPSSPTPLVAYAGRDDDGRDVSKPIAYDEHGNPLYAPRGILFRIR